MPAPTAKQHVLRGRDEVVTITARHLGHGSSYRPTRTRWFEVDIYRDNDGLFFVHTRGMTTEPGEITYARIVRTNSAYEIVDALIVTHNSRIYLPLQSTRALTQAAEWDDDCLEALRTVPDILAARQSLPVKERT